MASSQQTEKPRSMVRLQGSRWGHKNRNGGIVFLFYKEVIELFTKQMLSTLMLETVYKNCPAYSMFTCAPLAIVLWDQVTSLFLKHCPCWHILQPRVVGGGGMVGWGGRGVAAKKSWRGVRLRFSSEYSWLKKNWPKTYPWRRTISWSWRHSYVILRNCSPNIHL